ncbi:hypothetical protein ABB37_00927 [Leptomonas pyrrhocoris]|uniref:Uncharacterized protein n=1 Tax=Leptomonas pyrrhocoris TaxID=157538 RepID=A0A0M9GBN3_LEPPY|nr:hypothetical protein ABB37_00927 [Leptomonas pyrrhocoris]KPA86886.1 hypothetical protein ABB37_00927 [Leptomonas pyrrhocoris]|eukprot:XP_015665325.1 hypothetical protein ABB37_00927 [Leptomonas pyrrhocoris]
MSDSDWEVLSTDGDGQLSSQQSSLNATEAVAAEHAADVSGSAAVWQSSHAPPTVDRRTVLTPLCLSTNQTGTRLGVGHTKGFLVFRLAAAKTDASTAAAQESSLPAQSQLILDPQYNVDLLTFSHVRERMRQQRLRHTQQTSATTAAAATMSHVAPHQREEKVEEEELNTPPSVESVISERTTPTMQRATEREENQKEKLANRVSSSSLELDDLGSFLTAAGRAFAQLKRSDAHGDPPAPSARRTKESDGPVSRDTCDVQASEEREEVVGEDHGSAFHESTARMVQHRSPLSPFMATPTPSATTLAPISVLKWGKDEDIAVDVSESSLNDLLRSGIGDSACARRRDHEQKDSASRAEFHHSDVAMEEDEDEENCIGFAGGGVVVMSLLYDQTWLSLVGGGPTPMGAPNEVHFVRDGEPHHQLTMPQPVVKLFLDARLLFVVTTAELRVYTNPLEQNWVCLRQRIPLSASVAARYAAVPLAPVEAEDTATVTAENVPLSVWGAHRFDVDQQLASSTNPSLASASPVSASAAAATTSAPFKGKESHDAPRHTATTAASTPPATCVTLPSIPTVVDYARNLLLLPTGDTCQGFALYRYITSPEPVERREEAADTTGSASATAAQAGTENTTDDNPAAATTGRTVVYLQHIATQQVAHKNPLHNLALYVGWPTATSRLWSTVAERGNTKQPSDSTPSSASSCSTLSGANTTSRSAFERDRSCSGTVTLVAASSEYATRLTLWLLQQDADDRYHQPQPPSSDPSHRDPISGPLPRPGRSDGYNVGGTANTAASFVLLREFRVGLRLTPPKSVIAALPGVSRFMSRAHPSISSSTTTAAPPSIATSARVRADVSQFSSNVSLANANQKGGQERFAWSETEGNSTATSAVAATGSSALPRYAASTSTYRGTVAAWANEAASVVTACASAFPTIEHMQFIGNGAYLLCVHGTDALSVFSTSAPESEQEAKDVTRDRAVAERNRYSRLSIMKEYLPRALSNRLDAYTRQAWSSCSGRLPSFDTGFVPRWLYLWQQDAAAAAAAPAKQSSAGTQSCATALTPQSTTTAATGGSDTNTASRGGRRLFHRLTALVGSRSQQQRQLPAPSSNNTEPVSLAGGTHAQDPLRASPVVSPSMTENALAIRTASPGRCSVSITSSTNAPQLLWGAPLTGLSRCVCIWSASSHHGPHGGDSSRGDSFLGAARRPIVLNCATCEGAFTNVFLFAEDGEVVTSRVLPYEAV